jgi:hypothetical protein
MRTVIFGCLAVALIGSLGGARGALATGAPKPTEDGKPTSVTTPCSLSNDERAAAESVSTGINQ